MRELKFRGKRLGLGNLHQIVTEKDWVYGSYLENDGDSYIVIEHANMMSYEEYRDTEEKWHFEEGDIIPVHPDSVGQLTGLKDKNGVEVYEGDVVKCRHITTIHVMSGIDTETEQDFCNEWEGFIKWQSNSCSYTIKHLTRLIEDKMLDSHEYEVIGNIHQHPELLK